MEESLKRKKHKKRHVVRNRIILFSLLFAVLCGGFVAYRHYGFPFFLFEKKVPVVERLTEVEIPEWIDPQIIHIHTTARTGRKLTDLKSIVIHYVGNPGTSAKNNRDYFDNATTRVSSHFLVGLEGEVIQCLPLYERSAASNQRNKDTISIEVCHPDESGKFSETTYASLVKLTAWLLEQTGLQTKDIIRHYDITGKLCPLYYVEHEDAWNTFKKDVEKAVDA